MSTPGCKYLSHAYDWDGVCALCARCRLYSFGNAMMYSAWRRASSRTSTFEVESLLVTHTAEDALNAISKQESGCTNNGQWRRGEDSCVYKTQATDAKLSADGAAYSYFHFLVDFIPRLTFAVQRDRCTKATLLVPGWWPLADRFRLTARNPSWSTLAWFSWLFNGIGAGAHRGHD